MLLKFLHLCCVGLILCCMLVEAKKNLEVTSFLSSSKYDKTWIDWKTLRLTKTGPSSFVISGDVIAHYNLGDEQRIEIKVMRHNPLTNNYATFFTISKTICKFTSTDQIAYPTILEHTNLPPADTCPIPKGNYKATNIVLDTDKFPNTFPSGEYKLYVTIYDGTKAVAGLEGEGILSDVQEKQ